MSVTSADNQVEAIIDLLQAAASTEWNVATNPTVKHYWDDAQSERGPGADQPAILYVWSPTGSTLEQFSVDGEQWDREDSVEVQIWSIKETDTEVRQLQKDVVQILSNYIDDNKVDTAFNTVLPSGTNDYREQNAARRTDHFIMSVEVDTRGLDATALA